MPSFEQLLRLLIAIGLVALSYSFSFLAWNRLIKPFFRVKPDVIVSDTPSLDGYSVHRPTHVKHILFQIGTHVFSLSIGIGTTLLILNFYVYHGFGFQPDVFRKGDRHSPWVTLTFDDGPSADYTLKILDVLDRYDVKATFFMVGSQVESYPHIAEEVVKRGHDVGNHTWSHVNVPTTDTRTLYEELIKTSLTIMDATGTYPGYSRPARGLYDGRFRRMSDLLGHRVVLWTLSAQDWYDYRSSASIVRRIVDRVRPGDILLFHDSGGFIGYVGGSREHTIRALEGVIVGVREKGLEFVPLAEFLTDVEGERNISQTVPDLH